jgi:hypothetical protein
MTTSSQHSLTYLRFLNLVHSIRQLPSFPVMDAVEERMLNLFASTWHAGEPITVLQAMGMLTEISSTTAHRRLKTLRKKGLIALNTDEVDNRIKYVVPTDLTNKYFAQLGQCLDKAQRA